MAHKPLYGVFTDNQAQRCRFFSLVVSWDAVGEYFCYIIVPKLKEY